MADEKIKGKVKWFSIRKGFGFITPSSDNAPTEDGEKVDIFFHQTSIVSDVKNAFLATDYEVEFEVYTDENGKYKSKNVTQPGGAPCEVPERPPRKRGGKGRKDGEEKTDDEGAKSDDGAEKENGENKNGESKGRPRRNNRGKGGKGAASGDEKKEGENGGDADNKKPGGRGGRAPRKRFDDGIPADVKAKMKEKKLDMRQTSLLVVVDKCRLKFGPEGYAALAHADGIMAEGSFTCDDEGKVTLTWKNMLKFEGGDWKTDDPIANTSSGVLIGSFSWTDDNISGLKTIETPESLWGEDKTDPAEALQSNNFQMRKCFLAKAPANPRNRRRPRNRNGKGKGGDAKAADEKKENGDSPAAEVKAEG